jgi:hypothetical protein
MNNNVGNAAEAPIAPAQNAEPAPINNVGGGAAVQEVPVDVDNTDVANRRDPVNPAPNPNQNSTPSAQVDSERVSATGDHPTKRSTSQITRVASEASSTSPDKTHTHYKSRRTRFSPAASADGTALAGRIKSRSEKALVAGRRDNNIVPSYGAGINDYSPVRSPIRRKFLPPPQSELGKSSSSPAPPMRTAGENSTSASSASAARSYQDAAKSSRAYDIEGSVGKMKAWNDNTSNAINLNDIEVDPLDSLMEASIKNRLRDAMEDLANNSSVSISMGSIEDEDDENDGGDSERSNIVSSAEQYIRDTGDEGAKAECEEDADECEDLEDSDYTDDDTDEAYLVGQGFGVGEGPRVLTAVAEDEHIPLPLHHPPEHAPEPPINANPQVPAEDAANANDENEDVEINDADDNFVDPDDADMDNVDPQAAADVHIALDRLLGLRAFGNLLRNSLWLLAFNFVFIAIFVALPYLIGLATVSSFENSVVSAKLYATAQFTFPVFVLITEEAMRKSSASGDAFQVLDLVLLFFGYAITFFMIFALNEVIKATSKFFTVLRGPFSTTLSNFSNVIKVGLLLYLRVFFLPLVLGGFIMRFLDVFMDYPSKMWVDFFSSNIAGAGALAWVLGITYMVTTTLTVLQLREVLHPKYLASFVRPQEPHLDLLNSLMVEPLWIHCRRICASMMIYMSFLIMFVLLPLYLCRKGVNMLSVTAVPVSVSSTAANASASFENAAVVDAVDAVVEMVNASLTNVSEVIAANISSAAESLNSVSGTTPKYRDPKFFLHLCYFVPQIQIPFEVTIAHFSILTIVDRKKNIIGRLMHSYLLHLSRWLGITRFLLPHPYLRVVDVNMTQAAPADGGVGNNAGIAGPTTGGVVVAPANAPDGILYDEQGLPLVGAPMKRPLPGWDSKTNRNLTRWAWINEPLSDLERSVAPVVVPSFWFLRVLALFGAVWLTLSLFSLTVVFGPLLVGRSLMLFVQMPFISDPHQRKLHDPLCFAVGCFVFGALINLLTKVSMRRLQRYAKSICSIPANLVLSGNYR